MSLLRARREAVSELVEDGENSPISVGVNTAQAVAGSVWGKDAVEAFLFIDDPLDSPQLFELCSDLPHVFGGNKVRPDDTELSWRRFRHPANFTAGIHGSRIVENPGGAIGCPRPLIKRLMPLLSRGR